MLNKKTILTLCSLSLVTNQLNNKYVMKLIFALTQLSIHIV